jgi:hypothetical protein
LRAAEQDEAELADARAERQAQAAALAPERLVFLDGSAALANSARPHAWSPRGGRAPGAVPGGRRGRAAVLGAPGPEGTAGATSIEAATDGAAVFFACLDQVPLPGLRRTKPDAVTVMDNLAAPRTAAVRARPARRLGLRLPPPPASFARPPGSGAPEPIEPAWAKVKGLLRRAAARTVDALHAALALAPALDAITAQDAQNLSRRAGHGRPS